MATVRKHRTSWAADYRDHNGRRHIEVPKGYFPTKTLQKIAAQELLNKRLAEIASYTFTRASDRLTFAALAEMFLESKVKARTSTIASYRELLRLHIVPYFGERKAETIRSLDVERFRNELAAGATVTARKPGPRTVNKCLTLLVGVFNYAKRHRIVVGNPAEEMDKLPTNPRQPVVLTADELRKVFAALVDPYRIPLLLIAYTGAREGEALGLRWSDVNWSERTVAIRRQYRAGLFSDPKTKSSARTVELPAELVLELRRWRLACPKGPHDLICPSEKGGPMSGSVLLQSGLYPAEDRAGVRRARVHDLRHSFASNLLAAGVDVVTVSKALGHANVNITLGVYSHSIPGKRLGATDAMARLLERDGNSLETPAGSGIG